MLPLPSQKVNFSSIWVDKGLLAKRTLYMNKIKRQEKKGDSYQSQ